MSNNLPLSTPPPSRQSSEMNEPKNAVPGPLESIPLPLSSQKKSIQLDKSQQSSFFKNYNLNRLYSLYGIYDKLYKLYKEVPDKSPAVLYIAYDLSIDKMKKYKDEFNKKKGMLSFSWSKKTEEMNQTLGEVIPEIENDIEEFDKIINEISKSIKDNAKILTRELNETEKILQYSRFNRIFRNKMTINNDDKYDNAKIALLYVYKCEVQLWRDAIPPPAVNPEDDLPQKQEVAQDEDSQKRAVKQFLDRFGRPSPNCIIPASKSNCNTVGEEYIRVYISILEKIPADENFKATKPDTTFSAPNVKFSFTQAEKEELKNDLIQKITHIINIRESVGKNPEINDFEKLTVILRETTDLINKVEKCLDSRKTVMETNVVRLILQDKLVDEKERERMTVSGRIAGIFSILSGVSTFSGGMALMMIIGTNVAFVGATFGLSVVGTLIVTLVALQLDSYLHRTKFPLVNWLMRKLFKVCNKDIWKKNGWEPYNENEKWCVTIERIKPIMIKTYEYIWVLMLYTEKRILWDNLISPFLAPSTEPRQTFMDGKDKNLKKANDALTQSNKSSVFSKMPSLFGKKTRRDTGTPTGMPSKNGSTEKVPNKNGDPKQNANSQTVLKTLIARRVETGRLEEEKKTQTRKNQKPKNTKKLKQGDKLGTAIGGTRRHSKTRRRTRRR